MKDEQVFNFNWYYLLGTENTFDQGFKGWLSHIERLNEIIIGEPMIFTYSDDNGEVNYTVGFDALSKLDYLEYKYKINNND